MKIPPLVALQKAIAYLRTRLEATKLKHQKARDQIEAYREEAERQNAILEAQEQEERPQLLEAIEMLTEQLLERFTQLNPKAKESDHWHIDYFGPVNQYVYLKPAGTYTLGFNGQEAYEIEHLDNSGLRRFIGMLHLRVAQLDESIAQFAAEAAEPTR